MKTIKKFKLIIVPIFFAILLFWKSVFFGQIPFPGNYLLVWNEPWKSLYSKNGIPILPHKAVLDDVFRQLYQYKTLAGEIIHANEFPLWNPFGGAGMPLMAVMHPGFLTPMILMFVWLPGWLAWTIYIEIQPIFVAFTMLLYFRKLGISFVASVFATVVLLFSGFFIVRYQYGEYIYVAGCLPLLLAIVETYIKDKTSLSVWGIPFIVFFMIVSGQPQIILYVLLFFTLYIAVRLPKNSKAFLVFFGMIVLGFTLSAVQLMPTWELWKSSNLNTSSSLFIFDRFLLPIRHLIEIVIPNYFGNQGTYNYWGVGDYTETAAGLGLIPVLFSIFALTHPDKNKHNIALFMICIVLGTIFLTVHNACTEWIYRLPIPLISTGVPTRIFFLTTIALSVMSGIGFDALTVQRGLTQQIKRIIILVSCIVSLIVVVTLGAYIFHFPCPTPQTATCRLVALRNTGIETASFIIAVFLVIAYLKKISSKAKNLLAILIFIQICLGIVYANKFLPFSGKETIFPETSFISAIKNIAGYNRVFGFGEASIRPNISTALKIYDPQYYDPLYIKRYGELVAYAENQSNEALSRSDVEIETNIKISAIQEKKRSRLLNVVSASYLLYQKEDFLNFFATSSATVWQDNHWVIEKNLEALPRAYIVNNYEVIKSSELILQRLFDKAFDPSKTVILEQEPLTKNIPQSNSHQHVGIIRYTPNEVLLRATQDTPSLLVLTDNNYPGWKAFIDNKETSIYRANYTFRAIVVPKGTHRIRFVYQPQSFFIGAIISLLTFILLGIIFIYIRRRRSVGILKRNN